MNLNKKFTNYTLACSLAVVNYSRSITRDEDNPERGGDMPGVRVPEVLLPDDVLLQRRPVAGPHLVLAVGVGPEVHLLPLGHLARVHVRAALVAGHARVASEGHYLLPPLNTGQNQYLSEWVLFSCILSCIFFLKTELSAKCVEQLLTTLLIQIYQRRHWKEDVKLVLDGWVG